LQYLDIYINLLWHSHLRKNRDFQFTRLTTYLVLALVFDTICCTSETHNLEDAPDHKALSYCWGIKEETVAIKLQMNDWQITTNLYAALKTIRQEDKSVMLWMDAICINQDDIIEKNHQIRLIGEIFESAVVVCMAWGRKHGIIRSIQGRFRIF